MTLSDLLGDPKAIGRMADEEFRDYWEALGKVVRLACRASEPEPPEPEKRGELSCTNASTQLAARARDWRHPRIGFGLEA